MLVRKGNDTRHVRVALSVFRIADDGTLQFVRKYDVELGGKFQWWQALSACLPPDDGGSRLCARNATHAEG